jgi:hypothetical protein
MARARNIKPGFFKNEDLAECSAWARLCFAGLWTLADREGRLEDRAKRIKGELFPFDSIEVEPLLVELVRWKFIDRYVVDGVGVIQVLKFAEHQTPHFKEVPSVLPPNENPGLSPHSMNAKPEAAPPFNDHGTRDGLVLTPHSTGVEPPGSKGGESPLNPESGFLNPESLTPIPPRQPRGVRFADFWAAWPRSERKVGKADCEKRWKARNLDAQAETILTHVEAMKGSDQWMRGYEPSPSTYLNQRRWEDDETLAPDLLSSTGVNRV